MNLPQLQATVAPESLLLHRLQAFLGLITHVSLQKRQWNISKLAPYP